MSIKAWVLGFWLVAISNSGFAQTIARSWVGVVPIAAMDLHLVFNIKQTGNEYSATFDSPDQHAFGLPCSKVTVFGDSVSIEIAIIKGGYKGLWNHKDAISGVYSQNGGSIAMTLKPYDALAKPAPVVVKPQTPKPPFNYYSEDVEYDNADKSVHYGATFTRPKGNGQYPAVIIITGSGTQDRDGTMFGHKLYYVLADYLTRNGIAVLRVDDRGAGKSTLGPNPYSLTSADFSHDVETSLNYLETRADVDQKHLGLIGHSEGAMIAPMVAARRKDVAFIVCWGYPAVGGAQTSMMQVAYALKQKGVDSNAVKAFDTLQLQAFDLMRVSDTHDVFNKKLTVAFNAWKTGKSANTLKALNISSSVEPILENYDSMYDNAWVRYFMTYDPLTDLRKVTCPVLTIIGTKDTQVDARINIPLVKATLAKRGNKDFEALALPGLNHFLQTANTGDVSEYGKLDETISPSALKIMGDWIKGHVR